MGSPKSAIMQLWSKKEIGSLKTMLPRINGHLAESNPNQLLKAMKSRPRTNSFVKTDSITKVVIGNNEISLLHRRLYVSECTLCSVAPYPIRCLSSQASKERGQNPKEAKKEISTVEDPFDSPTYNIPEKPVTFTEGASYSLIILAGLGVAAFAGYGVFKELIFEPKEYTIFNKALKRIQDDAEVRVRVGYPITGYGQETRNRAARQRIPNRTWTDEDGVEHIEVNFHIRGPHGAGKVFSEMYKDQVDRQWKFTYLIVEIKSPTPAQLILESYLPSYAPA